MTTPPLPPGFVIEDQPTASGVPPLPPGFELESGEPAPLEIDIVGGTRESAPDPTDGMSTGQRLAAGFGRSIVETGRGLKQAATNAGELLALGVAGSPEARQLIRQGFDPIQQRQQQEIDTARQMDAPLLNTAAGATGNVAGLLTQMIGPGLALRGTTAGAAFLPTTIGGNAAQGAAIGALQPAATGESRALNAAAGGTAGAAGAALFSGATRGINALRNIGRPGSDIYDSQAVNMLLREAADPASISRSQPSSIPGVTRTLAEETRDEGLARLEQTLRGQNGFNWGAMDSSNNIARINALEALAGNEADMASAIASRGQSAATARETAMQAGQVEIPQTLNVLDDAINSQQGRPAVQGALQQIKNLLMRDIQAGIPENRIAVLENVRMTIGDMLSGKMGGESAAALRGSRELINIRDALNEEIGSKVPSFTTYLNAYRQGSIPINRMEVGREILDRGTRNIQTDSAGNRMLAPKPVSNAVRDLDSIAQSATGFAKAKAEDILRPSDIAMLKSMQDDLERQSFARSAGTGGNSASASRAGVLNRMGSGAGNAIAGLMPYGAQVRSLVQLLDEKGTDRLNQRVAYLVANPDEARRVHAALSPSAQRIVSKALTQIGGSTAAAGAIGSTAVVPQDAP